MLEEVLADLALTSGQHALDCTLGGGGHTEAMLLAVGESGQVIGLDVDREALAHAQQRLSALSAFRAVRLNFGQLDELEQAMDWGGEFMTFDAILMDLGVSSPQLDRSARGFSFRYEGPLDMRMDDRLEGSALELVAEAQESELARIFRDYGEESQAGRLAHAIVRERSRQPIETTTRLAEIVEQSVPATLKARIHPATRVFQALRIAVNDELGVLERALPEAFGRLRPGGRLSVLTYHSLEDRIVKSRFSEWVGRCTCPRDFPVCQCGAKAHGRLLRRKPAVASEAELQVNPRARSAKLRTIERLAS